MNQRLKVHVEIRSASGVRENTIAFDMKTLTLYDVLDLMSKAGWAKDLFEIKDGEVSLVPGYLMVLEKRMVQQWEAKNVLIQDDQHLKFVQVVAGG